MATHTATWNAIPSSRRPMRSHHSSSGVLRTDLGDLGDEGLTEAHKRASIPRTFGRDRHERQEDRKPIEEWPSRDRNFSLGSRAEYQRAPTGSTPRDQENEAGRHGRNSHDVEWHVPQSTVSDGATGFPDLGLRRDRLAGSSDVNLERTRSISINSPTESTAKSAQRSFLTPLERSFALIEAVDFYACLEFYIETPSIAESGVAAYLKEALLAYRSGQDQFSRACIARAIMVRQFSELDEEEASEWLADLANKRRSQIKRFLQQLDEGYENIKRLSAERERSARPELSVQSSRSDASRQRILREPIPERRHTTIGAAQGSLVDQFSSLIISPVNRHQSNVPTTSRIEYSTSRPEAPPERHHTDTSSRASVMPEDYDIKGTAGEIEKLDSRYRQRKRPQEFFKLGRVFALLWHENIANSVRLASEDAISVTTKGRYGEGIFSHIRRMVVVRQRHGCSWCVGISTYGGKGVIKKLRKGEDIQSHTIIYASNARPTSLEGEVGMTKEPIAVDMAPTNRLDPTSRLDFGKVFTVEHNVKAMEIGMVAATSLPYLEKYWREEMSGTTE